MTALKDMTPDQFKALYKKLNVKPGGGHCCVREGCCCGLGVLMLDNGTPYDPFAGKGYQSCLPVFEDNKNENIHENNDQFASWAYGFDCGFRGEKMLRSELNDFSQAGYKIGEAMKAALLAGEFDT